MPKPKKGNHGVLNTALAGVKTLAAGTLCNLLSTFLANVEKLGWTAAAAMLDPTFATGIIALAGMFGITKAREGKNERKKAGELAEEIRKLQNVQGNTYDLLSKIANQEIGVTVDWFTKQEIAETVADILRDGGLVKGIPNNNFAEAKVRQNRDFVGRREILDELHARLQVGGVALTHDAHGAGAQALRGEGGIGKTQIAVEYAYRHADDYEGRWWIDASKEAIDASTASLATTLGHRPGPQDTPEMICATIRKALSGGNHLLILDNLDDPKSLEGLHLPPPARVLITTRLGTLPKAFVREFPVSTLEPNEAVELLRKHRNDLEGDEHEEPLRLAAEHLGFHSLAVALAASYLWKHKGASGAELLDRLQRADVGDKAHLLADLDPTEHTAGYKSSVAQSLSLHLPDFADTPAMALLGLAAFCHPDRIPVDVFFEIMEQPKEVVENWLVKLDEVSIIHYAGQTISLHRLMQEVMRGRIDNNSGRSALTRLTGFLLTQYTDVLDYRNWSIQDDCAPHAGAALKHADSIGEISGAGNLGNQVGLYLQTRARFDAALSALHIGERISRAREGDDYPDVSTNVNNIGLVLRDKGDLEGALKCFREAERVCRAAVGDEHPSVATTVNNMGSVLHAKGDLEGALRCSREAERIDRAAYGDDHPSVARDLNNIGDLLREKGELDGALKYSREAHRITSSVYGGDDPRVATCLNNVGLVLHDKGDLEGALKYYRDAERIDRAAYGDDHPAVAICVNNIGGVFNDRGDLEGALKCSREAERIDRAAHGDEHPFVAKGLNNIGMVLHAMGDLEEALKCFREAERIDRAAYGDEHPDVALDVNNIGNMLFAMGDVKGATAKASEAFGIFFATAGPRALETIGLANKLTIVGVDPIPLAREIAGDEAANQLEEALRSPPSE